ncbi:MAG: hypothetical protein RI957_538 [Verrucomicrobiota bacterium]|jgi:hypothetical protein
MFFLTCFRAILRSWWIVLVFLLPASAQDKATSPSGADRHLFILAGQSNMTLELELGFRDLVHRELGESKVAIVRQSKSGRGIRFWVGDYDLPTNHPLAGKLKAGNGEEFPKLVAAARSAGDAKQFTSVTLIWMQGESDANRDLAAAYAKSFCSLMDDLKAELGISQMHFVIGRISDYGLHGEQVEGWKSLRKIQVDVAASDPRGAWIDTDDLNGGDEKHPQGELHYPAEKCRDLGARFAEIAVKQCRALSPKTPTKSEHP